MQPDINILDDLVRRIRAVVQPVQIVLFGSAGRGEMTADSDLDVLVVVSQDNDCGQIAKAIYRNLIGFALAVDIVVTTQSDIDTYADQPGLIYRPALQEDQVIYAA